MIWSICFGLLAFGLGFYALAMMPHEREVKSLSVFVFKLLPFFAAAISISLLDLDLVRRLRLQLIAIAICFLMFFIGYVPKLFFDVIVGDGSNVYYMTLVIVPVVILSLTLAYRLGGASTGNCLRLSIVLLLLMLSGIEDVSFFLVNHHEPGGAFNPIPEVLDWISHIKVRIGHYPTFNEVIIFMIVHLILAGLVMFLPFRFLERLKKPLGIQD